MAGLGVPDSQGPVAGLGEPDSQGSKRHRQRIKFKVLDGPPLGNYERSPGYQCSSTVVFKTSSEALDSRGPLDRGPLDSMESRHPVSRPQLDKMDIHHPVDRVDSKYRGNYERNPNYQLPRGPLRRSNTDTAAIAPAQYHDNWRSNTDTAAMPSKYRGDYERDPNYMRWQQANKDAFTFDPSIPHSIPHPAEVLDEREGGGCGSGRSQGCNSGRTDKYRGDYDRCETYDFPPVHSVAGGGSSCNPPMGEKSQDSHGVGLDKKYSGNYERDPIYMEKLKQIGPAAPAAGMYTTLEASTRQAVQPYSSTVTRQHSTSPPQTLANSQSPPQT